MSEEDLSKAIGRRGQNARLTSRLVGMDLIIERDEHASEVFEGQMGTAVSGLQGVLQIDAETARLLTEGGFGDLRTFAYAGVDDVAEVLGGDLALAEQIVSRARANGGDDGAAS